MPTEIDPNTLQYVNHDAKRTEVRLAEIMASAQRQNESSVIDQPTDQPTALVASVESEPEPILEPALEPAAPEGPSPEEWEAMLAENATWKKRHADATRALTPAQQKAARLDKELKEHREQENSAIKELKDTLAAMVEEIKALKNPKEPIYNPEQDRELDDLDPAMADRLRKMNRAHVQMIEGMKRNQEATLAAVREQDTRRQQVAESEQDALYQNQWEGVFSRLVPDYADYLPTGPMGEKLVEWCAKIAPEYTQAMGNPYSVSPHFVANIIRSFKATLAPAVNGKKPSIGDLANPQLTGSAPLRQTSPEVETYCTDYEMQNARKIHEELCRKHKMPEAAEFQARFERTLLKRK